MTTREEQAADAGFNDGLNGKDKFFSFKPLTDKETAEYKDQYEAGLEARKGQVPLANKH